MQLIIKNKNKILIIKNLKIIVINKNDLKITEKINNDTICLSIYIYFFIYQLKYFKFDKKINNHKIK